MLLSKYGESLGYLLSIIVNNCQAYASIPTLMNSDIIPPNNVLNSLWEIFMGEIRHAYFSPLYVKLMVLGYL